MKRGIVLVITIIFALSFLAIGAGCGQAAPPAQEAEAEEPAAEPAEEPAGEQPEAEMEPEETVTEDYSGLGPLRLFTDKPGWQNGWDAVFAGFKEKTGIGVEMTGYTEIDTYTAAVKTGITTQQGPDVFTWWSNFKLEDLAKEGLLADMTDIYAPLEGKYNPGILESFSYDGTVYGAPVLVASWIMLYNTNVFDEYGLSEPANWDEFVDVCETLKSNGVTPIALTITGGWTSFFWFQQILASNYPEAYKAVCAGEQSYESEEVEQTFLIWKDMIEKGYFTDPGVDLGEEIPPMFARGEVAMTYCGDWFTAYFDQIELAGGEDYSMFVIPAKEAGVPKTVIFEAGPLCISANAANKEAAELFVQYWLSDEGQLIWSEAMNYIPPNADVDTAHLDSVKKKIADEVFSDTEAQLIVRYWEATLETITLPACAALDKFVLNPDSYMDVMAELEQLSSQAWAEFEGQ